MQLRETQPAVTLFGGLVVFFEFLRRISYREACGSICRPHSVFALGSSGSAALRHTSLLRAHAGLHTVLGISRFPIDDTVRNLFKRFGQRQGQRFFSGLWNWPFERRPECRSGYSLDLDSTVFERYGHQQGALRGPNPRKHGRPWHHRWVAVLAEAHFLPHGWLRSGNCGTPCGVVEFLKELWRCCQKNISCAWCVPMRAFLTSNYWGFWVASRGPCALSRKDDSKAHSSCNACTCATTLSASPSNR